MRERERQGGGEGDGEKDIFVGPLCYANYIVPGYCLPIMGEGMEMS